MVSRPCPGRADRSAQSSRILLLALLAAAAVAARAQQPGGAVAPAAAQPNATAREVRLTLTVTNEQGRYVNGLGGEHVEVFEGKAPREIRSFGAADEHASVGVLFDISRSMREGRGQRIERARQAFARFVRQASPTNEYFLRAFNKNEIELTDWTRDAAAIKEGLDKIAPATVTKHGDGGTALYDACASALAKLAGGSNPRRVLLVFTDGGQDNYSRRVGLKDLKRVVRDSGALLYAVAIFDVNDPSSLDGPGQADLDELVSASGGGTFFVERVQFINAAVDQIAVELRHQYAVGFAPADAAKKGELNKVRVRIKPRRVIKARCASEPAKATRRPSEGAPGRSKPAAGASPRRRRGASSSLRGRAPTGGRP